jgi:hypothetical protein
MRELLPVVAVAKWQFRDGFFVSEGQHPPALFKAIR